jgi:hypothetical protein
MHYGVGIFPVNAAHIVQANFLIVSLVIGFVDIQAFRLQDFLNISFPLILIPELIQGFWWQKKPGKRNLFPANQLV